MSGAMDGERGDVFVVDPKGLWPTTSLNTINARLERQDDHSPAGDLYGELAPVRYLPVPPEPGEDPSKFSPRTLGEVARYVTELGCRVADHHANAAYGSDFTAGFHEQVEHAVVEAVEATLADLRVPVQEQA